MPDHSLLFLEKAELLHGGKYDYSKVEYQDCRTKVIIVCPTHGDFWQTPKTHLQGCGCLACSRIRSPVNPETEEGADVVQIPLRNNEKEIIDYALVSVEEYHIVKPFTWHLFHHKTRKYAMTTIEGTTVRMHHLLEQVTEEYSLVDHINGLGLDNRKENRRLANAQQNAQNREKREGCSSKYIGVSLEKKTGKWTVQCCGKHLGKYDSEEHAAAVYDAYVVMLLGPGAKINGVTSDKPVFIPSKPASCSLPVGVRPRDGKFYAVFQNKHIAVFSSIAEANAAINKVRDEYNRVKAEERLALPILRNADGIAIIQSHNKKGEVNAEILVDDVYWHDLMRTSWCLDDNDYAHGTIDGKDQRMHNYLFGPVPKGHVVDHVNKLVKDNRKANLRSNTRSGNSHNRSKKANVSSKYHGVHARGKKFRAQIIIQSKRISLGDHFTESAAARAYNTKALEVFGDLANLNIIEDEGAANAAEA